MSAKFDAKHDSNDVILVKSKDFRDNKKSNMLRTWVVNVFFGRVEFSIDLIASNVRYYHHCSVSFRTKNKSYKV